MSTHTMLLDTAITQCLAHVIYLLILDRSFVAALENVLATAVFVPHQRHMVKFLNDSLQSCVAQCTFSTVTSRTCDDAMVTKDGCVLCTFVTLGAVWGSDSAMLFTRPFRHLAGISL